MEYVCGFLINREQRNIALVRKLRPAWQKGKLNGIGGKVEPNELPLDAMRREFAEETGYDSLQWTHFCTLGGNEDQCVDGKPWAVYCYYQFTDLQLPYIVSAKTDEEIVIRSLDVETGLHRVEEALPNLSWLIPMALNHHRDAASSFTITENYIRR
jgi:8-oxo-dGTP diphosphatase